MGLIVFSKDQDKGLDHINIVRPQSLTLSCGLLLTSTVGAVSRMYIRNCLLMSQNIFFPPLNDEKEIIDLSVLSDMFEFKYWSKLYLN